MTGHFRAPVSITSATLTHDWLISIGPIDRNFKILNSENDKGTCKRQICECDRAFTAAIEAAQMNPEFTNGKASDGGFCRFAANAGITSGPGRCCKNRSDQFSWFNSNTHTCCAGDVVQNGMC